MLALFYLYSIVLFAGEYKWYIQSFPWVGEEGEDPMIVFSDLIEQDKLVLVKEECCQFWYDECSDGWINDIGKIRNGREYKICVRKDVTPIKKKYSKLILKPGTTYWLYYIEKDGTSAREVFSNIADKIISIKSAQTDFESSTDLDIPMYYGKVYGIRVNSKVTINWKINE